MKEYVEELSNEKLNFYTAKVLGLVLDEKRPESSTIPNTTAYTLAGFMSRSGSRPPILARNVVGLPCSNCI